MNRLQKKCIIVSAGIHLLLAIILIVGPAFLSSSNKKDNGPILNFVAVATVDAAMSGGGSPTASPPPIAPPSPVTPPVAAVTPPEVVPPAPQPQPKPVEQVKVAPVEPPKVERPSRDVIEPVKPPKHKIEISDKLVTLTPKDVKAAAAAAAAARDKQAAKDKADAKRKAAEISRSLASLQGHLSASTSVEMPGPGGGGPAYANFYDAVRSIYFNAWRQPEGAPNVTAKVSVTIARDGTVISARIIKSSGNSLVDRTVQDTIERVKFAAPLPSGVKENERPVIINFNTEETTTTG